ncbi:hypothetical protein [Neisseria sicca]|uniref:hypothetical protein n=1 Tax=Neisseria sicca TaxID=490 RepID=UPI0011BD1492|nr:hypothetical protein [Neisseria sicca]
MSCFPFLCSGAVVVCGRFCVVILWRLGCKANRLKCFVWRSSEKRHGRFRRPFESARQRCCLFGQCVGLFLLLRDPVQ